VLLLVDLSASNLSSPTYGIEGINEGNESDEGDEGDEGNERSQVIDALHWFGVLILPHVQAYIACLLHD